MKITPFEYQREDVQLIEQWGGVVLNCNQMGVGKTLETLWALKRNPDWLPALVVVPAQVKFNWDYEARILMDFATTICESRKPPKYNKFDFSMHAPIVIINYDILHDWIPYLKHLGFRTLVCDEAQALQNPGSIRTRAVRTVSQWPTIQRRMMLTGTPVSNHPRELYPILNILWPHEFPNFSKFAHAFCKPRWTTWGWKYDGAEHLDILHGRLKKLGMLRRRIADVVKDLPIKNRRIIPCELSNPSEYKQASEDFIGWLKQTAAHRVESASRAEALTRIGYLLRLAAKLKFKTPVDWANRFLEETDEKLVIMAVHQPAIRCLQRWVKAKHVVLDGSIDSALKKHLAVQQFQTDPNTRVLIGSRTAWTGVNLTAASTMAATEFWWNPTHLDQMESRIYRIGQKSVSFINYFVAIDTIEERICEIVQTKQGIASSIVDGGTSPNDINLYELLLNELKRTL